MNKRLTKILDYEKQLMESRKQLLELLAESETADSELLQYKLQCFQKEIAFMNRQVELLKQEARLQTSMESVESSVQAQTFSIPVVEAQVQTAPVEMEKPQTKTVFAAMVSQQMQATTVKPVQVSMEKQTTHIKKDLEKTVGKSLMGIFASVLIFISLILFATLLLPYFNDTAKMVTTYIVSFTFLGVGLVKLKKDGKNKFFLALTGCGIGALYISLLLSNIYFKVLGDIPLYILICAWGIGVCLFAKQQSRIFQIIGELGITISVIFGCIHCIDNQDTAKFLAIIIFYIISAGVFYFVNYRKEFIENLIHHISNVINVFILASTSFELVYNRMEHFVSWVVLGLVLLSLASTLWHSLEKKSVIFSVFTVAYVCFCYGMLNDICFNKTEWYTIIVYGMSIVLIALVEWKRAARREGKYIVQAVLLFFAIQALSCNDNLYDYGMVPMLILPTLIAGFLFRNIVFKYGSLAMLVIYTFVSYSEPWGENLHFLLECVALVVGFVLVWWKKEQYDKIFKYSLHVITLLFIFNCVSDVMYNLTLDRWRNYDLPGVCNYLLFTLFNIGMMKSVFGRNLLTGEKENPAVYNIANMLAMLVGTFMIADGYTGIWNMLLILTVLGAFMINAKNFLEKRTNLFAGIYVGVKFTVLMVVILESFDSVNYVVSIACLIMAIACIVLGFVREYKSLRVFGLILSMISIFKLIMVDISYDNTLGNAISFFVSGILCFAISLIYNYIDNKFKERA